MASFEKYIPVKINLDEAPDATFASGDRKFLPSDMLDSVNCRFKDSLIKSIPGNILKSVTLPSGINKIVGSLNFERDNTIVYFLWNSNGQNSIREWNPETEIFTTLMTGSVLNFSNDRYISHCFSIDKFVCWLDAPGRINQINVDDARSGEYLNVTNAIKSTLAAPPPHAAPVHFRSYNPSLLYNKIRSVNVQFAYRYIYKDGQYSVLSSYSKISPGYPYPDQWREGEGYLFSKYNTIEVTVNVLPEFIGVIYKIEVAYRLGNSGDFNVFETIRNPTNTSYVVIFTGDEPSFVIPTAEAAKIYDGAPITKASELIDNRVFAVANKSGFFTDDSTYTFNAAAQLRPVNVEELFLKTGGTYYVGLIFTDRFGNNTFVKKQVKIEVPFEDVNYTAIDGAPFNVYATLGGQKNKVAWSVSGLAPVGATSYKIVLSKNRLQTLFFQCSAQIVGHIGPLTAAMVSAGIEDNHNYPGTNDQFFILGGEMFSYANYSNSSGGEPREPNSRFGPAVALVLILPINAPFEVQVGDKVRIHDSRYHSRNQSVKRVMGNYVWLSEQVAGDDTDIAGYTSFFVDIYRDSIKSNDIFYEVGDVYPIATDRQFSVTSGILDGDTYILIPNLPDNNSLDRDYYPKFRYVSMEQQDMDPYFPYTSPGFAILGPIGLEYPVWKNLDSIPAFNNFIKYQIIETPTRIAKLSGTSTIGGNSNDFFGLDYTKADANWGRPFITNEDAIDRDQNTVVVYSDPYVQDTNINGLTSFNPKNSYPLPVDRGPISALVRAVDVLLAIHERKVSSLYVGQAVLEQNDQFLLARSANVVADDRNLRGDYGTINPESVLAIDGLVLWWDQIRGAFVMYSKAGLDPISRFGMWQYFIDKSKQLNPHRSQSKVISIYDHENAEVNFTFCDIVDSNNQVIISGETWVYLPAVNEWKGRRSFVPEQYAGTTTRMVSFKAGEFWLHHASSTHNNFYNQQYQRSFKMVCNPRIGKNKKFLNIHIAGMIASDEGSEFIVARFKTPEGQESYTPAYVFEKEEGMQGKRQGEILKDINTPVGAGQLALRSGDDLVSNYMEFEVINDRTDSAPCSQVNIIFVEEELSF